MLWRRTSWAGLAAILVLAWTGSLANANVASQRTFYLDLKVGQCAKRPSGKTLLVVPCSNPAHNLETYVVAHGGWGHGNPPGHPAIDTIARSLCMGTFQRRFGHPIPAAYGYQFFFPDRGAETTKYGDRFICSLRMWPAYGAMGAGKHFR
jgi:hypothetical protein